jgi:hypothetical protein
MNQRYGLMLQASLAEWHAIMGWLQLSLQSGVVLSADWLGEFLAEAWLAPRPAKTRIYLADFSLFSLHFTNHTHPNFG